VIEAIRRTRPDVVVPYFLGADLVRFNRAFAEAGLHRTTLRYTSGIDETLIYGTDEDATENLYAFSAHFGPARTKNNQAFLERYHSPHGDTPPPSCAFGQFCYEGVHCLAALVEASDGLTPAHLRAKVGRMRLPRTARGGEIAGGLILFTSPRRTATSSRSSHRRSDQKNSVFTYCLFNYLK
jgi:urea transport system substrate-binding protein